MSKPWDIFTEEQTKALADNLHPSNIKTLKEGSKAQYIEGWHAINEANRIFGFGAWDFEVIKSEMTHKMLVEVTRQVNNRPVVESQWRVGYLYVVRVTVHGDGGDSRYRDGTGYGDGFAKENALAAALEKASKEAETDAMKRALRLFGNQFGLALYDKEKTAVGESNIEEEAPPPRPDPPAAQLKIAEGLIADFAATEDPAELWKHPNTKRYLKAWHATPHNLYERIAEAAKAAKERIEHELEHPPESSRPGAPFDDEIPF